MTLIASNATRGADQNSGSRDFASEEVNPEGGHYRVQVAGLDWIFRQVNINVPDPTGRDLLESFGAVPAEEFVILRILANGELESLRLDEHTRLHSGTDVRFVAARSDRTYRFMLENQQQEWAAAHISGIALKRLGQRAIAAVDVFIERREEADREIGDEELVDLAAPGVERFYFRPVEKTVEIIVNRKAVKIERGERSGLEVKEAAIEQKVPIKLDFVLSLHKAGGGTRVIGDTDRVRVHRDQRFTAVADDDVS